MPKIAVFDSGVGGLGALGILRARLPRADIIYLSDCANAPYGVKKQRDIYNITKKNIEMLKGMGADRILVACGTASSMLDRMPPAVRHGVTSILPPLAKEAARYDSVGILATDATVRAGVLVGEIRKINPKARIRAVGAPALVCLAEGGRCSPSDEGARRAVEEALAALPADIGVCVLGCTHFPRLLPIFRALRPRLPFLCSGEIGAGAFLASLPASLSIGKGKLTVIHSRKKERTNKCQNTEEDASTMPSPSN